MKLFKRVALRVIQRDGLLDFCTRPFAVVCRADCASLHAGGFVGIARRRADGRSDTADRHWSGNRTRNVAESMLLNLAAVVVGPERVTNNIIVGVRPERRAGGGGLAGFFRRLRVGGRSRFVGGCVVPDNTMAMQVAEEAAQRARDSADDAARRELRDRKS